MMEPICVTIKRTLSIYHPLHAILQWHCRGTFVTNSIGLPNLVNQYGYMHRLLAIGDVGSIELLNRGYLDVSWDDTDFKENLKVRPHINFKQLVQKRGIVVCFLRESGIKDFKTDRN